MAQIMAGEIREVVIDGKRLTIKIEDASKGEVFSARIEASDHDGYGAGQICEFDRAILRQ